MRLLVPLALLLTSVSFAQQQQTGAEFPKTDEINLVVTQAERAFDQYKNSVVMEQNLESSRRDSESLKKDQELVEMSHKLVVALKGHPDGFNGVGGLLLLSTLDDASRNAALCSSSGAAEIAKKLIDHINHVDHADHMDINAANQIMLVIQNCSDVSMHLYTVSESVHALMVRELDAQQDLNQQAMDMVTKCNEAMKPQPKK
jgi:hypothetical protein